MPRIGCNRRTALTLAAGTALWGGTTSAQAANAALLNVSDDSASEFYKQFNPLFARHWERLSGERLKLTTTHGEAGAQARSVLGGAAADVVTLSPAHEIDALARANLLPPYWAGRLPNNSAPTFSVPVILVRKGNPKRLLSWADLGRTGVTTLIAHPRTASNGRYAYLAAWGAALRGGATAEAAQAQVGRMLANVPAALVNADRAAALAAFTQGKTGDALVLMEFEALPLLNLPDSPYDAVYPDWTIVAEQTVAWLDKVVERNGTRKQAEAYLRLLWSDEAQALAARYFLRPRITKLAKGFKGVKTFSVDDLFGGWDQALKTHFAAGGVYDQLTTKR